jgi:copper chaperone CopZ
MTHTYNITGMTCGSCVSKVKSELLKLGDVTSADVQLAAPQATITMERHIDTTTLQAAVKKAGNYSISDAPAQPVRQQEPLAEEAAGGDSYFPIFLLFGYILGTTGLIQLSAGVFSPQVWMRHFMAGFFLVFSFFKLLNLKGFAEGYSTYDVIAKKLPAYGFVYPFIELLLAAAFITGFHPMLTNAATLLVMAVSAVGVVQSLLKKTRFQCACLGTVIKLPLSKVTLFEDLLMVAMSAAMLFIA